MENRIAEKISATKQPFYYQSIADGDIKEIQETVKQLDKNIKQRQPLHYKFDTFKEASHYSLILYSIPNAYHIFMCTNPYHLQNLVIKLLFYLRAM
jgi:hypothetical protein